MPWFLNATTTKRRGGLLVIFPCHHFRARVDLPKKIHLGSGLNQRDEAADGFLTTRIPTFPRPKKTTGGVLLRRRAWSSSAMVIMGWRMVIGG